MSDTDEMKQAGITYDETVAFATTGVLPLSFRIRRLLRWVIPTLLAVTIIGALVGFILIRFS